MSSQFKYHSQVDEVVPWQATYTFPTQATKVNKQTVKIVPKNGGTFQSGNIIRIEFPSDNYLNVLNSYLQFDAQFNLSDTNVYACSATTTTGSTATYVKVTAWGTPETGTLSTTDNNYNGYLLALTRAASSTTNAATTYYSVVASHGFYATGTVTEFFLSTPLPVTPADADKITLIPPYGLQRGGAQNFIKRLRVMYGSLVLEDILEYKTLVRMFYEAGVDPGMASGSGNILEGMTETRNTPTIPTPQYTEGNQSKLFTLSLGEASGSVTTGGALGLYQSIGGSIPGFAQAQLVAAPAIASTGAVAALTATPYSATSGRTTFCINLLSGLLTQKKLIPL